MVMLDQEQEGQDYGHVNVSYLAPGSAMFNVDIYGVAPVQILALANYLEVMARKKLLEQLESQSIQVARPNILVGEK